MVGVYSGCHLDASVVRRLRYVPLGRGPDEDPGPAVGTVALSWPQNTTPSLVRAGGSGQGEGSLNIPAQIATRATQPQISIGN